MSDNITLPRELAEKALEALEHAGQNHGGIYTLQRTMLRTALASEQPKQEHFAILAIACKDKEIDRLTDENEALRRDAERYRYLRNRDPKEAFDKSGRTAGVWIDFVDDLHGLQLLTGDDADTAIDAEAAYDAAIKGDKT